jgi:integrase
MPRRFVLEVRKAPYSPKAPYLVHVPKALYAAEGAQRRFFEKESIAQAYVKRLAKVLGEYQLQALGLDDEQKVEAAKCFRLLEKYDAGLLTAVQHYIAYLEQANSSVSVGQLFGTFMETKKQDGLSPKYLADLRSKLGRFVAVFRNKLACDLTTAELEIWIRGLKVGAVSRESYRRNIGVMLEFGRRRKLLRENPAADIKIARRPEGEVTILTHREVSRLLQECSSELVPYIAICAFAGLRPTEAANLDWKDIYLETAQIEVKARHAKTRRHRLVPIQPNLLAWLTIYRKKSGPIGFSRRKFREAYAKAGFKEWPLDVLRHSFGTYRLPILKSAESLALEMGNSPDVIFRHYRRAMSEANALGYFNVKPSDRFRPALRIAPQIDDGDAPVEPPSC